MIEIPAFCIEFELLGMADPPEIRDRTWPSVPRFGERVRLRTADGAKAVEGIVSEVAWADFCDGVGRATGEVCVTVSLDQVMFDT